MGLTRGVLACALLATLTSEARAQPPSTTAIDFTVESEPSGALVIADGQVVGQTPLDTQLLVAATAETEGIRVTVSLDGYQPMTLVAHPRRGVVVLQVALRPLSTPAPPVDPAPPPVDPAPPPVDPNPAAPPSTGTAPVAPAPVAPAPVAPPPVAASPVAPATTETPATPASPVASEPPPPAPVAPAAQPAPPPGDPAPGPEAAVDAPANASPEGPPVDLDEPLSELGMRLGFFTGDQMPAFGSFRVYAFTLEGFGRLHLGGGRRDEVYVDLDVAASFVLTHVDVLDGRFRVGNPHVGLWVGYRLDRLRFGAGLHFGVPFSAVFSDAYDVIALRTYELAASMHAWDSVSSWRYSTLSVLGAAEVRYDDPVFQVGGELRIGGLIGIDQGGISGNDELAVRLRVWGQAQPVPEITLGGGIGLSHRAGLSGNASNTALSLSPHVHFNIGYAYIGPRFTINLIDPLGFSFDTGKVWALSLELGGRL